MIPMPIGAPRREPPSYGQPDWVVLGAPQSDGKVMVLASKKLTRAELEYKRDLYQPDFLGPVLGHDPSITLTVEMTDYTMIVADTYEQALRSLFEQWAPEPDRPALDRAP